MRKFIDEIADAFVSKNDISALKRCIITPNRRASRFIKKGIMERNPEGGFLPQIFSIDEFIFHHLQLIKLDEVDLTFHLYEVMQKQDPSTEIAFEVFLNYSSTLIHDFNEIDMNMANGKSIFSYLSEAKAIQQWNPDGSPLSASQKEYLRFYNQLAFVYEDFRARLYEEQACYQGMAYRHFAENCDDLLLHLEWENITVAGFNALTTSEEIIIKKLVRMPITQVLWDVDHYYLDDALMEAGFYMRKHKTWSTEVEEQASSFFLQNDKEINIIGSPGVLGQARLTNQILEAKNAQELSQTVVIPADENLLLPLLNSLSKELLEKLNITMGFPITHSHTYRLIESFIRLHLHAHKLNSLDSPQFRIHKTNLTEVLNNELLKQDHIDSSKLSHTIPLHFIGTEMVSTILQEAGLTKLAGIFKNHENNAQNLNDSISFLIDFILETKSLKNGNITEQEIDALMQIKSIIVRLSHLINKNGQPKNFQTYYTFYKQLIKTINQSFLGKFDEGLQLMGLLETRLMDFKNVILLSTNEDILPASSHVNSFIPADIRYEYELPGIQERTAVFAYHFYRLIQRAKNIEIIYSTTKRKMSGGEKSRFIKQLQFELPRYNKEILMKEKLLNFEDLKLSEIEEITIKKDKNCIEKLETIAKLGLSPTHIISYVRCPLQFYFKKIAKIKEPEEFVETIDERMIGNVIHHLLEDFYKPFIGIDFPFEKLKELLKDLPDLLKEYFAKNDFKGQLEEGANYLSYKDTLHYLQHFIKHEINVAQNQKSILKIVAVEDQLERELELAGNKQKVLIKGIADRIDFYENQLRILDYKTGKVEEKNVKIPDYKTEDELNKIFTNPDYDKALQLYIYYWMYDNQKYQSTISGIISFRKIQTPYLMLKTGKVDLEQLDEDFTALITEIFNPEIPFTQTNEEKTCRFCIYKQICGKKA